MIAEPHTRGRACAAGVRALPPECDIVVFLGGDGSDRPEFMHRLIDNIKGGMHDFVIGPRTRGRREPWQHRCRRSPRPRSLRCYPQDRNPCRRLHWQCSVQLEQIQVGADLVARVRLMNQDRAYLLLIFLPSS